MPDYKGQEGLGLGYTADGAPTGEGDENWFRTGVRDGYQSVKNWFSGGPGYETQNYGYREGDIQGSRRWDADSRANQQRMAEIYGERIAGRSPSVAQQQMEAQNASNKAQQLAIARSGGGGALGQAGAMRTAQMTAAQQDLGLQRNAGLVRAQEQMQAEAGLADLYGQQRQQDQSRLGAEMGYETDRASVAAGLEGTKARAHEDAANRNSGGGIIGGIKSLTKLSDRTLKTDVVPTTDGDLEDFLEAAKTYWWKYKNESEADDGGKQHVGPMAQDLAKTKMGRTMVTNAPSGKMAVDVGESYGAFLAGLGELHDRVKALESEKGGR